MEGRASVYESCPGESLAEKIRGVLNRADEEVSWNGVWYSVKQVYSLRTLCQTDDEEIYMVIGTTVPKISTHPRPTPYNEMIMFSAGQGRRVLNSEIYEKVKQVHRDKLLANDQGALLDVAEIIGRIHRPYFDTNKPMPILTEQHINDLQQKYGTTIPNNIHMKSEWLSAVHLPQLQIDDGIIYVQFWARIGEETVDDWTNVSVPVWRVNVTITKDDVKVKSRRIQHCYEDKIIEKFSSGNFKKNLNFKLFDTAFTFLAKNKFTDEEEGYTPGDDKFKKFFVMKLKRYQNMTPESILFLLHNCFVETLDLANIHNKSHESKAAMTNHIVDVSPTPSSSATNSTVKSPVARQRVLLGPHLYNDTPPCAECARCAKVALQEDSLLVDLNLNNLPIDNFDVHEHAVNTNITRLSLFKTVTALEVLDLLPNLETLVLRNTITSHVTPIERLTRLKSLDLQNTCIIKSLNFQNLSQLTSLNIRGSWEREMRCEDLSNVVKFLPNLEKLEFTASYVTTLTALCALKHLRTVEMSQCYNGECLNALTNIQVLKLSSTGSSRDKHWSAIGQMTRLEELEILPYVPVDAKIAPYLAKLTNLKYLNARQSPGNAFELLDAITPDIERLHLSVAKFDPKITKFTALKSLVLSVSAVAPEDQFYETIAKLTQLEALELSPMTNEDLGKLSTLINLKELNIRQQKHFDSDGAVYFKHFTKLQRVSLYATPLSDLGLVHLTKLDHLEYLSLKRTCVSDEAIEFLENHRAYLELDTGSDIFS